MSDIVKKEDLQNIIELWKEFISKLDSFEKARDELQQAINNLNSLINPEE